MVNIDVLIMGHVQLFSIAMEKMLKRLLEAAVPIGHATYSQENGLHLIQLGCLVDVLN